MKTSWTCFVPLKGLLEKVTSALFFSLFFSLSVSIGFSLSSFAFAQESVNPLGRLIFEASVPGTTSGAANEGTYRDNYSNVENDTLPDNLQTQDFTSRSVEEYQDAISKSIDGGDLYSQTLSEQYEALGIMLYRSGHYEAAIEAFDDAIHIHKVNKGLFNLDQARIVGHLIDLYTKLGDFPSVDNNKHYLYYIQNRNLDDDDPRLLAAMQEWADWNIEAYTKGYRNVYISPLSFQDSVNSAGQTNNSIRIPFTIEIPNTSNSDTGGNTTANATFTANVPSQNANAVATSAAAIDYAIRSIPIALSSDLIINERLYEAENIYLSLLEEVEQKRPDDLLEQQVYQENIANINFLLKKELEVYATIRDPGSIAYNRANQEVTSDATLITERRYVKTKNNFEALVTEIDNADTTTPEQKASAYIALGDMHLSFDRSRRAFDAYSNAYAILVNGGKSQKEAIKLITPRPDVAVPAYGIHNYSRNYFNISPEVDIPYNGHIDVVFSKDRFGMTSSVVVTSTSEGTPDTVRSALVSFLRNQRFRPEMNGSDAIKKDDIQLRYFYYY
jgi:tetratricopeptide (TPR) repeat protein